MQRSFNRASAFYRRPTSFVRRPGRAKRSGTGQYIDPSRFINKAVITEQVEHFVHEMLNLLGNNRFVDKAGRIDILAGSRTLSAAGAADKTSRAAIKRRSPVKASLHTWKLASATPFLLQG